MNKDSINSANNANSNKLKKYVLDMFPYPSGEGLHVGHPKGYIATDIYSRMYKMKGYDVVHPMGWDAFGLPAEQFALKNKTHPKIQTEKNIANFKKQLEKINLDYDWNREVSTTDPKFYKWTQWIFKQLYKKGLAYESNEPINWCPSCKTGLANEDLEGNACERCGTMVEKKPLRQWNLRITDYADRLIKDLDDLAWPDGVKTAQKNWIGRSEGSEIDFKIVGEKEISFSNNDNSDLVGYGTNISMETKYTYENKFTIFTTRADTLFGCTYCVLAPEHKLVKELLGKNILQNKKEVQDYIEQVKSKTDIERGAEGKEKTGVKLEGVMAINPANQKEIPVYIADYVLASYGTGAIMAVPAHDERDYEFAIKYDIPKKRVLSRRWYDSHQFEISVRYGTSSYPDLDYQIYPDLGYLINSEQFNGLSSEEAKVKITEYVGGKVVTRYKLRDWVFARQRYWGEPFPVVYATKINKITGKIERDASTEPIMVADSELPVLLPEVESYEPTGTGESPLAIIDSFVNVYGYLNKEGEFISVPEKETKIFGEHKSNAIKRDRAGVVIEKDGKILCERLNSKEGSTKFNGKYLLIGGGIDEGEKIEDAIVREIQEELGVESKIVSKIGIYQMNWFSTPKKEKRTMTHHIFSVELDVNKINNRNDHDDVDLEWVLIEDFIKDCEENQKEDQADAVRIKMVLETKTNKSFKQEIKLFKRETNTMPQWAGSSWYYLRFLDPNNENFLIDPSIEKEWQGKDANSENPSTVDVYVGGDHATRHLIYARFWHKFLYDIGIVTNTEPFARLEFLGFVLAEDGSKMSKSKGNTINPDDIINEYGSDTFRLYEMFMAPFEATAVWNTNSIRGVKRFVERVEKLKNKVEDNIKNNIENIPCANQNIIHQTIKKVGEDIENFKFNTCVSQFMIAINEFEEKGISKDEYDKFMTVLFPFAPSVCAEYKDYAWPIFDENKLQSNTVKIALQINGKLRDTFDMTLNASEEEVKLEASKLESYEKYVTDTPQKIIVVKNKIINIVV